MVLAEFLALMTAAVPAHPPVDKPDVATYNAIVATDKTPGANDLAKPAVFISDGTKTPIVGSAAPGPIA